MKNFKVVAYITAYEDLNAVEACIAAIRNQSFQIMKIFVVDNSKNKLLTLSETGNLLVEHHPENLGISGGLRIGLAWAIVHNYDFLWAFDQDSTPTSNCLEVLLKEYSHISQRNYEIGIIAPTAIDFRTNRVVEGAVFDRDCFIACKHKSQNQPYECDAPITSGSLISIATAKAISPPRADLFIDGVDFDYGLQIKQKGFHNLVVPQAILHHNFGSPIKVKFLHKEYVVYKYSALRHYYICRNHTYLDTRYARGWYRIPSCLKRIKYLIYTCGKTFLLDEDKALKIWACLLGTYHGFKGKLGKTWL